MKTFRYRLHGLAMDPRDGSDPVEKALHEWRIPVDAVIRAEVTRESLDARKANRPVRKFTLEIVTSRPFHRHLLEPLAEPKPDPDDLLRDTLQLPSRVHVVGSGPCGIACAIIGRAVARSGQDSSWAWVTVAPISTWAPSRRM